MCPYCQSTQYKKKGFYSKQSSRAQRVQRYKCHSCKRSYSAQTGRLTYCDKKPHLNQIIFRMVCSGISFRRIALNLGVARVTVDRKICKLARFARAQNKDFIDKKFQANPIFDEMETFEHSKCKPLSIAIAVDDNTREILGIQVSTMPAKGKLAAIARKKYGYRPDLRGHGLRRLMETIRTVDPYPPVIKSDLAPRYPKYVRDYFPDTLHKTTKGRRGCVVGQGELKAGGFDPIFTLNHTCAMVRDNIKRMSRRTWCTTKSPSVLQDLMDLYMVFHNQLIRGIRLISVCSDPIM